MIKTTLKDTATLLKSQGSRKRDELLGKEILAKADLRILHLPQISAWKKQIKGIFKRSMLRADEVFTLLAVLPFVLDGLTDSFWKLAQMFRKFCDLFALLRRKSFTEGRFGVFDEVLVTCT